ncbi:MAG: hypothetical protein KGV51_08260, partial [Moraxellaceae bacterium]|nr:hypothetical protein [Moraxellaceae bacterium]
MQPIYNQQANGALANQLFVRDKKVGHAGLWFEKFYEYQIFDNQGRLEANERSRKDKKKAEKEHFLAQFKTSTGTCGDNKVLENHAINQRLLCQAQGGIAQVYSNNWLMAIGLGNSHPLENGMLWHPTLGVPYFQGSTVKGMAKA